MKNRLLLFIFLISFPFLGLSQWISVPTGTSQDFWAVDFVDSQIGYCSGGYYKTFKTIDGGMTWADVSNQGFKDFSFFNNTFGFATSSSVDVEIARTTDGGNSWTVLESPSMDRAVAVSSTSENTAYFAGNGGILYKTTNGGNSFSILNSGQNYGIEDILFTNTTTGYFVSFSILKKTTDNGTTWNTIFDASNGNLTKICFVNETIGYIAGDRSGGIATIWKTTDAGSTWTVQETGVSPGWPTDIDFYDENHGFVVGVSGLILYTDNGGASWTSQVSGTTSRLNSVKMTSPANAVVAGHNGRLLRNFGTLGVENDNLNQNFTFYPNPVDNKLTITGTELMDSIKIFNVLGKLLFEDYKIFSDSYSINFSAYSEGIYFLKVSDERGNSTVKKVIKK